MVTTASFMADEGLAGQVRKMPALDRSLSNRLLATFQRITAGMSPAAKERVISSVDERDFLFALLQSLPAKDPEDDEAFKQAMLALKFKKRLIDASGGALTADQVQALLGNKSVQSVYKAAKERRLLMVDDNGTKLFPAFQFDGNTIVPGLQRILGVVPNTNGWAILQYLVYGNDGPDGKKRYDLLRGTPEEIERLALYIQTLED